MATAIVGPRKWSMSRDEKGHRTYKLKYLVRCASTDGPGNALLTSGLPQVGDTWVFDGENDPYAWCRPEVSVEPMLENEPNKHFSIEFTFSTKPLNQCQDDNFENPLGVPAKISGTFTKQKKEATVDRFSKPIVSSSHEALKGPPVEFDDHRPGVKIIQNVANLQFPLLAAMTNTVNAVTLWGLPPRTIKMSTPSWERKFYGACQVYYERTLEFEVDYNTFDRDILDEGTKVPNGYWHPTNKTWVLKNIGGLPPDRYNPSHFIRFTDTKGNVCKVILDGLGKPSDVGIQPGTGTASGSFTNATGKIHVEYYPESDFTILGIPTSF